MQIELDSVLPYPREVVFAAYRDDITAFVEHLSNVRSIEVLSREEEGPIVRLHNRWHGETELPDALSARLEERFLSWDDHAVWDADALTCSFTIEPRSFRKTVRCTGRCDFIALDDNRTRLDMTGELSIEFDSVRGIPSFLAGSIGRTAEAFLIRQLTTNLEGVGRAIDAYLGADTVS